MEVDYYSKYLKYKSKYLELQAQIGGDYGQCTQCNCKKFTCKSYCNRPAAKYANNDGCNTFIDGKKCGHQRQYHKYIK